MRQHDGHVEHVVTTHNVVLPPYTRGTTFMREASDSGRILFR